MWLLFLVSMSALDCLRDTRPFGNEWWVVHLIKWGSFYPPLAIIWYRSQWQAKSRWLAVAAVIVSWIAWVITQEITEPPHWKN